MWREDSHRLACFAACALLWFSSSTTQAQDNTANRIKEIERALQRAEYQIAADLADSAITHFDAYSPPHLASIHALRALICSEKNESAGVDAHFLSALQLAPDFQLDPIFFSPALQLRFDQLRAKMPKNQTPVRVETRYVMLPDPRVNAAWKSLVLPGWGQRSTGQKGKGQFFTISAAVLAGATITAHILREQAEDDYINAGEENVVSRYNTYNRYHQWRNNLALGLGIVWSAAVLDALIVPTSVPNAKVGFTPANGNFDAVTFLSIQIDF